ncbi:N1R/p28-like protein [Mythimna separata entomopoxvirus 'L']|uniref:N1R/p28-like protein n=1 Tax=Mythimna separata entomopoxvirus 'L' TaxID=1293572 RepID=A0A916P1N1_9POXV|nr:N1R/p28-like protein [Mythimna separata entomopoxvirus 'L']CCU56245.1 N1R/p28-like protein [Mythimna separata entomopoxvirus 'L']
MYQINQSFYYYYIKELKIIVDIRSNYFNITKLCEHANKNFIEWSNKKTSKNYIDYLFKNCDIKMLTYIITGNKESCIPGIYAHPKLLNKIINWIKDIKNDDENGYYVYIASTEKYLNKNIFVMGFTNSLKYKLNKLNKYRLLNDKYYYLYKNKINTELIEHDIKEYLKQYILKYEIFDIFYECCLHKIINTIELHLTN